MCECISSPDNTFYDAEAAKKQAAMFIFNPELTHKSDLIEQTTGTLYIEWSIIKQNNDIL